MFTYKFTSTNCAGTSDECITYSDCVFTQDVIYASKYKYVDYYVDHYVADYNNI